MNDKTTLKVINVLEGYGCRLLDSPTEIGGIPFEFSAVLVGAPNTLDLVLVQQIRADGQERLVQKAQGVVLALDAVQSRRSLTLILFGADLNPTVETALTRFARVLYIEKALNAGLPADRELWDALSILRPVEAPTTVSALRTDPVHRVLETFEPQVRAALEQAGLLQASAFGTEAVTETFTQWVRAALETERSIS